MNEWEYFAVSPEGGVRIDPGREYPITRFKPSGRGFYIDVGDGKREYFCLARRCAHLRGRDWIIRCRRRK